MKLLVDQAVSWRVAEMLASAGHDTVHVRDLDLGAADDAVIPDRALSEQRVVITQDTGFGTLLAASGAARPSVIVLRLQDAHPVVQARTLMMNLGVVERDLVDGAIVVMTEASIRVRRLPIEERG